LPTGNLPSEGKKIFESVYNDRLKACKDKGGSQDSCQESAAKQAWGAVRNAGWKKDASGNWTKKAELTEFSMAITKASLDKGTNTMRWLASASDTQEDSYGDNMTLELFQDFLGRIEANELAPEDFRSDFWQGGMPYLSVSHYPDLNGNAVPGDVEVTYVDGDYLKAKGTYSDTPLGRACWKSVCADLYGEEKSESQDRVRISIAFLDWMHKHKSTGYLFERKSLEDFCPECLREILNGEYEGKEYLRGQLVHYAHTRVPVNKRTVMEVDKSMTTRKEDAASIVGEELAEELEEKNKSLVGKSEALVIKADEETPEVPEPIVEEAKTKDKKPMMDDEEDGEDTTGDEEKEGEDYGKKKKKDTKKSDIEELLSAVAELKSDMAHLTSVVIVEPPTHPLHEALETFKADYDTALQMRDINADDKLRLIQQSFDALGQQVIATIKAPQAAPEPSPINDMAKAFSEALQPLMQELGMLRAEISTVKARPAEVHASPPSVIPQRRSIAPTLTLQSEARTGVSPTVRKSETPNLRAIIERST